MFFLMKLCQNFLWASSFVLQKKKVFSHKVTKVFLFKTVHMQRVDGKR